MDLSKYLKDGNGTFQFTEGFAVITTDKGKAFIDPKGKQLTKDFFDDVTPFHEGIAIVMKLESGYKTSPYRLWKKKWNLLTTEGNLVLKEWLPAQAVFGPFVSGFAPVLFVSLDTSMKLDIYEWNFLSTSGDLLLDEPCERVSEFDAKKGKALIYRNGQKGYVSVDGKIDWE